MALAKERHNPNDSQIFTFFDNVIGSDHDFEQGDSSDKSGGSSGGGGGGGGDFTKNFGISRSSSTISSPNSLNSGGGLSHRGALNNYHDQPEDGHSTISFKPGFDDFMMNPNGSCNYLRFEQSDEQQPYSGLEYHPSDQNSGSISNVRLLENFNSIQTSSMYNPSTSCSVQENDHGEMELFGWPNPQQEPADHTIGDVATQESTLHKRPHTGESMQANKKQCNSSTKKGKPKSTQVQAKDPQSIAAKNRRERISERLKVLQDLVPNGSKVDLVTMLEKAISYVKFLQLQVKVLATDEFWPVQGGKAPELSQVKEAIDAIPPQLSNDQTAHAKNDQLVSQEKLHFII